MKKKFLTPEISVCGFCAEDIITESGALAQDIVKANLNIPTTVIADWDAMNKE